ncbi:hypothetical protein HF072_00450 [Bacillus sp. RO3]|nr:hypothetical protein [Bacillus sp. RO3]
MEKHTKEELEDFSINGLISLVMESEDNQESLGDAYVKTLNSYQKKLEDMERIAKKQSECVKNLHKYIFMNESIPEDERELIIANLDTVIRLY